VSQGSDGDDQIQITLLREYFFTRGPLTDKRILQQSEQESTYVTVVLDVPRQVRSKQELEEL